MYGLYRNLYPRLIVADPRVEIIIILVEETVLLKLVVVFTMGGEISFG